MSRGIKINVRKIGYILDYIFIFSIMYASGTPYASGDKAKYTIIALFVGVLDFVVNAWRKAELKKSKLIVIMILLILPIITMVVNQDSDLNFYIGFLATIVLAIMPISMMGFSNYSKIFVNLTVVLACISIVLFTLGLILPSFVSSLPTITMTSTNQNLKSFFNIYFYRDTIVSGIHFIETNRSCSMFREPGIWQAYIVYAILLIDLSREYENKKLLIFQNVILVISLITTFSTIGFISLLMWFIWKNFRRRNLPYSQLIILLVGVMVIYVFIIRYGDLLFSKFNLNSTTYSSFDDRYSGVLGDLHSFYENPILGVGRSKRLQYDMSFAGMSSANSVTGFLGDFGAFYVLILIFELWQFAKRVSNKKIFWNIWIFVLLLMQAFSQGIWDLPIFFSFLCVDFADSNNEMSKVIDSRVQTNYKEQNESSTSYHRR